MLGRRGFLAATLMGVGAFREHVLFAQDAPVTKRKSLKPVGPTPPTPKAIKADERINTLLGQVRDQHNMPGMVGALVKGDALSAIGVAGVRKLGSETPFRVTDRVHLGSNTKAMTATLLGTIVEEGKLSWGSTIREVFPERAKALHPDFQTVTLSQLLTHRAGLPHDGPWWTLGRGKSTTEQRKALLSGLMKSAPESKPGTKYEYSNVGYALAGLMGEQVTGKSWEGLMRERLFEPLEMTTAGFGIPGKPGTLVEPWGHREIAGRYEAVQEDNAPAMGPAGTVYVSVPDWAKFAALHLQAARGKPQLLKPETFRTLHTPPPGEDYAGGWNVGSRSWAGGTTLNHAGSNTNWYAVIWIAQSRDLALLIAANQGGDRAAAACEEATRGLIALAGGSGSARPRRRNGGG